MLLVANFFWGLSFPVIKAVMLLHGVLIPQAGSWFSAIYTVAPRFVLASAVLMALRPFDFWKVTRGEVKQGVIIGLFSSVGMLLQNDALQFTSASTSAFLTQFYAILIPIYVAVRLRRHPGWTVWVCCALVLAGWRSSGGSTGASCRWGAASGRRCWRRCFSWGKFCGWRKRPLRGTGRSG